MTREEAQMLLTGIAAYWPEFKYGGLEQAAAWATMLTAEQVSLTESHAAVMFLIRAGEMYPPNAPKFLHAVRAIRAAKTGKREMTAAERWEKLCECAKRGMTAAAMIQKCTGRTWSAVNQAGGWDRIRYANVETELPFIRQAFIKAYEASSAADIEQEHATLAIESSEKRLRNLKAVEPVKAIAEKLVNGLEVSNDHE